MGFLENPWFVAFLLFPGIALLVRGAEWLVDGSGSIAKRFGVRPLIIGLTVVAFGTSAPELVVNLVSCARGCGDLALANVLGSNIANILLVLGIAAIVFPLNVHHGTVWREIPLALLAMLVLFFMLNDTYFDGTELSMLTRVEGLVLLSFLAIFLYYAFAVRKAEAADPQVVPMHKHSLKKASLLTAGGAIALGIGGFWVVDGALAMTNLFGISQALVGATLVAVGTSLPELVTTVVAARRRDADIAVGNAVGSNIFNVFWILGVSAIVRPSVFLPSLSVDLLFGIGATALLFFVMFIGKRHMLERSQGIFFVLLYLLYMVFLFSRG